MVKIGISVLMWIGPVVVPLYCGVNLLYTVPVRDTDRNIALWPMIIQIISLFIGTAIVTGITQIMTLRVAAGQALADFRHRQTRDLVNNARKTAALQFISAHISQVLGSDRLTFRSRPDS